MSKIPGLLSIFDNVRGYANIRAYASSVYYQGSEAQLFTTADMQLMPKFPPLRFGNFVYPRMLYIVGFAVSFAAHHSLYDLGSRKPHDTTKEVKLHIPPVVGQVHNSRYAAHAQIRLRSATADFAYTRALHIPRNPAKCA